MRTVVQQTVLCAAVVLLSPGIARAQREIIPNDPYFKYQISFKNPGGKIVINTDSTHPSAREFAAVKGVDLDITRAWAITTGSKDIVVAILDDGFCYNHPDIAENLWHNPGETGVDSNGFRKETNGLDDDHNGYVDDVLGWDFVFNTPDPNCYIFDGKDAQRIAPFWHSAHAMGIIGAKGNNGVGVAGINWTVSMMLLKTGVQGVVDENAHIERIARAIRYAADNGARVINCSWGIGIGDLQPEKLREFQEAVHHAAGKNVLVVVAAGNDLKDLDRDENCTRVPACSEGDNLIKVAEIDFRGQLYVAPDSSKWVGGSNYGARRVDIAAIGQNYTTDVTRGGVGSYFLSGGTSSAAPVVSGVAALMLSVNPKLTAVELKRILLSTATRLPALEGKVRCGGMVDAYRAVVAAKQGVQAEK